MPVKRDRDGHRCVEAAVEVPGSPEEVWQAIATGSGISSWFVPTTLDERKNGTVGSSFGPNMDSVGTITEWNPPNSFVAKTEEGPGTEATEATEWIVEARSGDTNVVRVMHRWFAETDNWDGEFEGHAYGWTVAFFRILRLHLTHFPEQKCSAFDLAAFSTSSPADTWQTVKSALTIDGQSLRADATSDAPTLSDAVDDLDDENPNLLLRLDRPALGIAHILVMPMGDQTMISGRFCLYGDQGTAAALTAKQEWKDWPEARFPQEATT